MDRVSGFGTIHVKYRYDEYGSLCGTSYTDYRGGRKVGKNHGSGVKEAKNLENIHAELRRRGYTTPLSADIHFNPEAAIEAARHVEKVRINPGNFVDKRATFKTLTYTEEEYAAELERCVKSLRHFWMCAGNTGRRCG